MNNEKERRPIFDRTGKMGSYTVLITLLLLAVLIVINLFAASLPSNLTVLDTSTSKMYTLSETTERFLSRLDKKVTLYYLCYGGTEDGTMRTFLDRFAGLSDNVTVKVADPISDPDFLSKYSDGQVNNFSVIAVSDDRYKVVDYQEMYYFYNEYLGKMSYEDYQMASMYYGAYLQNYPTTQYFEGENLITGAIEYVSASSVPTVYMLKGHNESDFSETVISNSFDYSGVTKKDLNIALEGEEIPDDCSCLIINTPGADLTADEAKKIIAYLDKGGSVLLFTAPGCDGWQNLMSVTGHMGMTAEAGTVSEGDTSKHYSRNSQYIYPTVSESHASVANFNSIASSYNCAVLMPFAHGIRVTSEGGAAPLLTTSETATAGDGTEKKQYVIGAAAEKDGSKFVWIPSGQMLTDTFINGTNGGNYYFFALTFSWMQSGFASSLNEISATEISEPVLTVSETDANFWGTIFIFVVPVAIVGGGLWYWLHRRRK